MKSEAVRFRWDDLPTELVSPTLERRLICGERAMLAQVTLKKGGIVPRHQHVHEQFTYVLRGAIQFGIGDDNRDLTLQAGDVLHIPSNVLHEARVLEDSVVLDVFSPPREDWLHGTDTYLRR